jgi:hypothetical protein
VATKKAKSAKSTDISGLCRFALFAFFVSRSSL